MASLRSVLSEFATFALSSYPLACGVFTLLFVKERTKNPKDQTTEYTLLLVHTAVVALCGVCMKLRYKIGVMRALCAVESALLAANFLYISEKLGFTWWGKIRIAIRSSGVIIGYLLTSSSLRRSTLITRALLFLLSAYGVTLAIEVGLDPAYKFGYDRFHRWLGQNAGLNFGGGSSGYNSNFGTCIVGVSAGLLASSSLCVLFPRFRKLGLLGVLFAMATTVTALDCNLSVWTRKHRVDYYLAALLALDNVPVVSALLSLLS